MVQEGGITRNAETVDHAITNQLCKRITLTKVQMGDPAVQQHGRSLTGSLVNSANREATSVSLSAEAALVEAATEDAVALSSHWISSGGA